ncbi:hypothetical protein [Ursidibacter arcticus]|uniref:hypothetical protein n=1 Tax=Ursidibacter arcticus TaxID=1524965 RepID=UPI0012F812ED|nr:hypothetical protein [Ursidibacter arcticus]KAE9536074.1 hypothetical protein A1D25_04135 [Ursidibacter arcticus]
MRITQVQPMPVVVQPIILTKVVEYPHQPLRKVPLLSQEDVRIFANIEKKTKSMTIDDLMQMMGIN